MKEGGASVKEGGASLNEGGAILKEGAGAAEREARVHATCGGGDFASGGRSYGAAAAEDGQCPSDAPSDPPSTTNCPVAAASAAAAAAAIQRQPACGMWPLGPAPSDKAIGDALAAPYRSEKMISDAFAEYLERNDGECCGVRVSALINRALPSCAHHDGRKIVEEIDVFKLLRKHDSGDHLYMITNML